MTEAPERIWAYPSNISGWDMGFYAVARSVHESTGYVRADIHAAALERLAALEGALEHEVKRGRRHLAASTLAAFRGASGGEG